MVRRPILVLIATASAAIAFPLSDAKAGGPPFGKPLSGMTYESLKSLPDFSGWWSLKLGPQSPLQSPPLPLKPKPAAVMKDYLRRVSEGVDPADIDGTRRSYCGPARFSGFNGGLQDYVEFLFTPGRVTITNEMGLIRRISLTTQPMRASPAETYTGVSIGHWDGRTLVVETRGLRPDIRWGEPVYKRPIRIGRNVRILERFTLEKPDLMRVTTQWTAPDLLTRPYEATLFYTRDRRHEFQEITNCDETDRAFDAASGRERFDLTPPPDLPPPPSK